MRLPHRIRVSAASAIKDSEMRIPATIPSIAAFRFSLAVFRSRLLFQSLLRCGLLIFCVGTLNNEKRLLVTNERA